MILSDKAKSLRRWVPDALRAHITDGVTRIEAVQSLIDGDRRLAVMLADASLDFGSIDSSYLSVNRAIEEEHDHLVRCAIDEECDYLASILDDPEELAAYREMHGDLLIGWEDHL